MSDQRPEPIDERDPRHPNYAAAQSRPDAETQRTVNAAEYVAELEAMVQFLQQRVRRHALQMATNDKVMRGLQVHLQTVTAERDALLEPDPDAPPGPEA